MSKDDIDLNELTRIKAKTFTIDNMGVRTYEKDFDVQMDFTFEVNLDLV